MKTVIMIAEIAQKLNDAGQEKTQEWESRRQQEGQGGEEGRGSLVEMALKVWLLFHQAGDQKDNFNYDPVHFIRF